MFLIALKNTDEVGNFILCTLCSCDPRSIVGLPPDGYKQHPFALMR